MIKLGDIVTPEDCCWGHGYLFRVSSLVRTMGCESKYKLQRIEQALDLSKGPSKEQLAIIKQVEDSLWGENELQVLEPTPETTVKIKNPEGITIRRDFGQDTTVKLLDEIRKWSAISIDSSGNVLTGDKKICTINEKEEKEMDILKLYEGRKGEEIANNHRKERERILKEDEIQRIIIEMENQVNTILENQNLRGRLRVDSEELYTAETEEKLEELMKSTTAERAKLRSTLHEISALFEMTDDYDERIKILKNYKILNKDGKLSI